MSDASPAAAIRRIGIIGAGQMGRGIAHVCALAGLDVVLSDVSAAALAQGPKFFEELMAAVGSRDGREIVLALDALRQKGLDRDGEGRYFIRSK